MATRMQQRRGTATQWTTANPILNAGEIGFESDTNKFKIGDGTNVWADLDYFIDETELGTTLGDYVETSLLGQALGVATLNSDGKLESSQLPSVDELSQDAINTALTAGTGITKAYDDNANTITLAVDTSVIATKAELAEVSQDSINDALVAGTGITKTYDDSANTITVSVDTTTIQARVANVTDTEFGYLANVTSDIQSQIDGKISASSTDTLTNKTLSQPVILAPEERWNVVASNATGTINIDVNTAGVWYYTSNATANHTLNFRGSSEATLDSILATGDSVSVVWLNTNGATPYYPNVYQIDGATNNRTLRWQNATAPSAGNASGVDAYIFTIAKTAANTFSVFASSTRFA